MVQPHFLCVFEDVPHRLHGGAGIVAHTTVVALRHLGYRITVLALRHGTSGAVDPIADLAQHGIRTIVASPPPRPTSLPGKLSSAFRRVLSNDLRNSFWGADYQKSVSATVAEANPDAVFAYHWNALAALHGNHRKPVLGIVSDPANFPVLIRRQMALGTDRRTSLRGAINRLNERHVVPAMRTLLNGCDVSGGFAPHDVRYLCEVGAADCRHFRIPVPDAIPHHRRPDGPLRILHIGHLKGTATLLGIELLAAKILPQLAERLSPDSFRVDIVGAFSDGLPESLKSRLDHPSVTLRGRVASDEEAWDADVLIVPTPVELGLRVRIITGLAHGVCVVAHVANHKGLPELTSGFDSLFGGSAEQLVEHCVEMQRAPERRSAIAEEGRRTYERLFAPDVTVPPIARALAGLASQVGLWEAEPRSAEEAALLVY